MQGAAMTQCQTRARTEVAPSGVNVRSLLGGHAPRAAHLVHAGRHARAQASADGPCCIACTSAERVDLNASVNMSSRPYWSLSKEQGINHDAANMEPKIFPPTETAVQEPRSADAASGCEQRCQRPHRRRR